MTSRGVRSGGTVCVPSGWQRVLITLDQRTFDARVWENVEPPGWVGGGVCCVLWFLSKPRDPHNRTIHLVRVDCPAFGGEQAKRGGGLPLAQSLPRPRSPRATGYRPNKIFVQVWSAASWNDLVTTRTGFRGPAHQDTRKKPDSHQKAQ